MSTPIDPKVLDRIRRLKAAVELGQQKDSTHFSTEQEAQAWASLLFRLLKEHDLNMSDVEYAEKDETIEKVFVDFDKYDTGVRARPRRVPWMEALGRILAPAFNCQNIAVFGTSAPCFVGRKSDVAVLEYIYITLVRTADDMSEREAKTFRRRMKRTCSICGHGFSWHELRDALPRGLCRSTLEWDCEKHTFHNSLEQAHGFRRSFLNGFIKRLEERLEEERKKVLEEAAASGQALMRIDNALVKVKQWTDENMKLKRAPGLSNQWHHNDEGDQRGREVANSVKLKGDALTPQDQTRGLLEKESQS